VPLSIAGPAVAVKRDAAKAILLTHDGRPTGLAATTQAQPARCNAFRRSSWRAARGAEQAPGSYLLSLRRVRASAARRCASSSSLAAKNLSAARARVRRQALLVRRCARGAVPRRSCVSPPGGDRDVRSRVAAGTSLASPCADLPWTFRTPNGRLLWFMDSLGPLIY